MQRLTEIKSRIKSVSDTRKITGAMETISVAKARKATSAAAENAPLYDAVQNMMAAVARDPAFAASRYAAKATSNSKTLYLVLASNKGLAGGFNSNVLKHAHSVIAQNPNRIIFTVGYEAQSFFTHRQMDAAQDFSEQAEIPNMSLAHEIAQKMRCEFDQARTSRIVMFYTKLQKNLTGEVITTTLLPVVPPKKYTQEPILDPSPLELLDALISSYLAWSVYGALLQSAAAEHHARRVAMNSAGRNAGELLEELTHQFNSARQASVTTELNEIVSTGLGVRK